MVRITLKYSGQRAYLIKIILNIYQNLTIETKYLPKEATDDTKNTVIITIPEMYLSKNTTKSVISSETIDTNPTWGIF
jgi:hypothetical protein